MSTEKINLLWWFHHSPFKKKKKTKKKKKKKCTLLAIVGSISSKQYLLSWWQNKYGPECLWFKLYYFEKVLWRWSSGTSVKKEIYHHAYHITLKLWSEIHGLMYWQLISLVQVRLKHKQPPNLTWPGFHSIASGSWTSHIMSLRHSS